MKRIASKNNYKIIKKAENNYDNDNESVNTFIKNIASANNMYPEEVKNILINMDWGDVTISASSAYEALIKFVDDLEHYLFDEMDYVSQLERDREADRGLLALEHIDLAEEHRRSISLRQDLNELLEE